VFESTPRPRKRLIQQHRLFIQKQKKTFKKGRKRVREKGNASRYKQLKRLIVERVRPLDLIVHHSINPEKSIPAESKVHQAPLDNTLTLVAEDLLSPAPVLELLLGLEPVPEPVLELFVELDPVALLVAVTCPEISI
jgi:hypothetical protein